MNHDESAHTREQRFWCCDWAEIEKQNCERARYSRAGSSRIAEVGVTENNAVSDAKARAWISDFENEPPLHRLFPVRLANGKSVPGVHVICSCCQGHISGNRIHGRVTQSLPHVVTISANGYCETCDRMTHIDCRFRALKGETLVEWLSSSGQWHARELRQPTLVEKITHCVRRLVERLRTKR